MSTFVETLRALKRKQFITEIYIQDLLTREKITQEEYDYIIAEV